MSGVKLIRGYAEPSKASKAKDEKKPDAQSIPGLDERQQRILKRRSAPPDARDSVDDVSYDSQARADAAARGATLQRQISNLLEGDERSKAEAEEQIRKLAEQELQDDYSMQAGETQGREIEHVILVTHGIGQRLGLR